MWGVGIDEETIKELYIQINLGLLFGMAYFVLVWLECTIGRSESGRFLPRTSFFFFKKNVKNDGTDCILSKRVGYDRSV